MKDRLNEVLPAYKTEAVLNAIIDAEGYEKLQPIKDQWPALKKKLEEVFGDVARVENTDSIAQVLVSYSLRPAVRQGAAPAPTTAPVAPSPNITPLPTSIVPAKNLPSVPKIQPSYNLIDTFSEPARIGSDPFQKGQQRRVENFQKGQELKRIMASYAPALKEQAFVENEAFLREQVLSRQDERRAREVALQEERYKARDAREAAREQQRVLRKYGEYISQERKRGNAITSIDFALDPTDRFHPTSLVLRGSASERINQLLKPPLEVVGPRKRTRASYEAELAALYANFPEELGPKPELQRSKSLEERLAGKGGRGELQMTTRELREIIEANGLPLSRVKTENYVTVKEAGLLPPKITLISREDFQALGRSRMAQYLEDNQMVGISGGVPVNKTTGQPKPEGVLLNIFDRYKLTGSGLKTENVDIKGRFEIIDGEINAGNNNPQLIRDARKLLKEMVTKKLVTIYEAQTHLKHLRNLNKI